MSDEVADVAVDEAVDSAPDTGASTEATQASAPSPQASAAPAAAPAQASVWDAFKALPDFTGQDDMAIARRLYASMEREKAATQALQQYQQYIPYAQQYLQNREPFERWLASQREQPQQSQQPQQPVEKTTAAEAMRKWWNPPQIRESYKQYLVRDENGREVISPDAPLDAKHALYEYQKYKADFAQKFLTNPEEALGPMIQEIAQQQAQQIVQAQFEEAREEQYVAGLERENSDWLYDEGGQPTEEGLKAKQYVDEAAAIGIQTPEKRWEYATKMIERDLLEKLRTMQAQQSQRSAFEAALPQQTAPAAVAPGAAPAPAAAAPNATSQAQRDIEFLRREASRNPSRSAGNGDPRTPQAPLTFEQRLARQLARDGIS